ncbi:MAG: hypothetical protein J5626_02510 [Lachnospiraceae bacterium]|nr:hypothetical protein [Lachnospiraceae bacterium]
MKKKTYSMDIDTAGKMLENVFAAANTSPNKVPFDKIVLRNKQNLFTDNLFIVLSSVIFIITLILPLFFPHSKVLMSVDAASGRPLTVKEHHMEESSFSISFDGLPVDIDSSYMVDESDRTVSVSSYDKKTNTVVFPYDNKEYNIYVYDTNGKCIHLLLSPKKRSND